jgi:hypothetical protein
MIRADLMRFQTLSRLPFKSLSGVTPPPNTPVASAKSTVYDSSRSPLPSSVGYLDPR